MYMRLWAEEDGQTLVEYGLLTALLAIVAIAILTVLGRRVKDTYTTVNDRMVTSAV
ncbi:MAG: Flp family type IVb pilin [Fimbriimonadaceae bacterium]|nr:Flp family type IVb pilin [Fimbriimonadaceae bacterium]